MSVRNQKQSLNSSIQRRSLNKFCENHIDRLATHQLILEPDSHNQSQYELLSSQYFCEKCSIMLASQGFNVYKISSNTVGNSAQKESNSKRLSYRKSTRKLQIQKFMNRLSAELNELKSSDQLVYQYLLQGQEYYGEAIQSVTDYFKQIQQILELNKYKIYNALYSQRISQEQELRVYREVLNEGRQEIMTMIEDIESNIDTVETTTFEMYSAIMQGYSDKLQEISEMCQNIPNCREPSFTIELPNINEQFYNIYQEFKINLDSPRTSPPSYCSYQLKPLEENKIINQGSTQNNTQIYTSLNFGRNLGASINDQSQSLKIKCKENNRNILNTENSMKGDIEGSLGFSFEESQQNFISNREEYQLRASIKEESHEESDSPGAKPKENKFDDFSKISAMANSKQIFESRQSLGKYLNFSHSRQCSVEDADTLLIV